MQVLFHIVESRFLLSFRALSCVVFPDVVFSDIVLSSLLLPCSWVLFGAVWCRVLTSGVVLRLRALSHGVWCCRASSGVFGCCLVLSGRVVACRVFSSSFLSYRLL